MDSERVHVRRVEGRYPANAGHFDPGNIETTCVRESQTVRVRLDDAENPEFWVELVLEIET